MAWQGFRWEHPPYVPCPKCKEKDGFGILHVTDNYYERRCSYCQHSSHFYLPILNKKVIYIDQFALSEMFKAKAGLAKQTRLVPFWLELHKKLLRLVRLQQAVFPDSKVHLDESLLSTFFGGLKGIYDSINCDVSLVDDTTILHKQIERFALSWIRGTGVPQLNFSTDEIIEMDNRNHWPDRVRVDVTMDYTQYATEIRAARNTSTTQMTQLFSDWAAAKPTFAQVVANEHKDFGRSILRESGRILKLAGQGGVDSISLEVAYNQSFRLLRFICAIFGAEGYDGPRSLALAVEFLQWKGLEQLPRNRIGAYLFAAIARKATAGQKRPPSSGMLNDIKFISNYTPYVDAMFIDNECAALLGEEPLKTDLSYRAKIYCLNSRDRFLAYLDEIEARATPEVIKSVLEVHGYK